MKGRSVILGEHQGRSAAALMVDGQLEDLLIDQGGALGPGAICRAVVDRLVKGQGGVFLRLPEGERGFLREKGGMREGQRLLVQVSGVAEAGKAVPVSARLLFRGRYVIVTPGAPGINVSRRLRDPDLRAELTALGEEALIALAEGARPGLIFRSASAHADPAAIAAELDTLLSLSYAILADTEGEPELLLDAPDPHEAALLDWADPEPDSVDSAPDAFEHSGAAAAVDALLNEEFALPGGGWVAIEATRAMVTVDVNTGADTSPAAALKANIAAARALPRQLRLRGMGGQVVVDFAPSPKRDRGTIDQVLRAAFKAEGTETALIGWTAMGLYELSRKRDRFALTQLLEVGR